MSAVDTRSLGRDSLFLMADVRVEGRNESCRVKVRNLSNGGMMGEGLADAARGDRVVVDLRNIGRVAGSIAWTQGNRVGIAFDNEIDALVARQPGQSAGEADALVVRRPAAANTPPANWNVRKV